MVGIFLPELERECPIRRAVHIPPPLGPISEENQLDGAVDAGCGCGKCPDAVL